MPCLDKSLKHDCLVIDPRNWTESTSIVCSLAVSKTQQGARQESLWALPRTLRVILLVREVSNLKFNERIQIQQEQKRFRSWFESTGIPKKLLELEYQQLQTEILDPFQRCLRWPSSPSLRTPGPRSLPSVPDTNFYPLSRSLQKLNRSVLEHRQFWRSMEGWSKVAGLRLNGPFWFQDCKRTNVQKWCAKCTHMRKKRRMGDKDVLLRHPLYHRALCWWLEGATFFQNGEVNIQMIASLLNRLCHWWPHGLC